MEFQIRGLQFIYIYIYMFVIYIYFEKKKIQFAIMRKPKWPLL